MESARFDELLRALALGRSRRATLGTALGSLLGATALGRLGDEGKAKKHKKHKKKKKCKGGTKKCGKRCIPATSCCASADCGNGGTCSSGTCDCLAGFQNCDGACIPQDDCCGGCPADRICEGGTCRCDHAHPCPDGSCVQGDQCCSDTDCGGATCDDGFCRCSPTDDIACGNACCAIGDDEICNSTDLGNPFCQGGGCQPNDWCNGIDFLICADNGNTFCVCLSTADSVSQTACVDFDALNADADCSVVCANSEECPSGSVCVLGNTSPDGVCGCDTNFCVPLCESEANRRGPHHGRRAAVADMQQRKQRQR